jgi:hypothetical protein
LLKLQKGSKDINKFAKKLDISNKAESPYLSIPLAKAQCSFIPYIEKIKAQESEDEEGQESDQG